MTSPRRTARETKSHWHRNPALLGAGAGPMRKLAADRLKIKRTSCSTHRQKAPFPGRVGQHNDSSAVIRRGDSQVGYRTWQDGPSLPHGHAGPDARIIQQGQQITVVNGEVADHAFLVERGPRIVLIVI